MNCANTISKNKEGERATKALNRSQPFPHRSSNEVGARLENEIERGGSIFKLAGNPDTKHLRPVIIIATSIMHN